MLETSKIEFVGAAICRPQIDNLLFIIFYLLFALITVFEYRFTPFSLPGCMWSTKYFEVGSFKSTFFIYGLGFMYK